MLIIIGVIVVVFVVFIIKKIKETIENAGVSGSSSVYVIGFLPSEVIEELFQIIINVIVRSGGEKYFEQVKKSSKGHSNDFKEQKWVFKSQKEDKIILEYCCGRHLEYKAMDNQTKFGETSSFHFTLFLKESLASEGNTIAKQAKLEIKDCLYSRNIRFQKNILNDF